MIEKNQIRRFTDCALPNIKIWYFSEQREAWLCIFQEDFKYGDIFLTEDQINKDTEIVIGE